MSRINYLLNKYAHGTCSSNEYDELMYLLGQQESDQELRSSLRKIHESLDKEIISDSRIDEHGSIIQQAQPGKQKSGRSGYHLKMVATVAIVAGVSFLMVLLIRSLGGNRLERQKSIVSTPSGSKTSVELPDGTKVWLNAKSSLTYTTGFVDGKREVSLVGEAMFDVKHDSLHPFVVHTAGFDVTDLGTVFNIRAYPEDRNSEAALISGSIEISLKKVKADKILLVPNQKMILKNDEVEVLNSDVSKPVIMPIVADPQTHIAPDTSWMVNKLIFKDETFEDLAMKLERRYNVEIDFKQEDCGNYRFTGRFEDETIDEALQELQLIAPFSYSKKGNRISISN